MLIIDSYASALRRDRLRLHADLESRLLDYLRERENPFDQPETCHAYIKGQLDLIRALRRCAVADAIDA